MELERSSALSSVVADIDSKVICLLSQNIKLRKAKLANCCRGGGGRQESKMLWQHTIVHHSIFFVFRYLVVFSKGIARRLRPSPKSFY